MFKNVQSVQKCAKVCKSVQKMNAQKINAQNILKISVQKRAKIVQKKFATNNIKLFPNQEGI